MDVGRAVAELERTTSASDGAVAQAFLAYARAHTEQQQSSIADRARRLEQLYSEAAVEDAGAPRASDLDGTRPALRAGSQGALEPTMCCATRSTMWSICWPPGVACRWVSPAVAPERDQGATQRRTRRSRTPQWTLRTGCCRK